VKTCFLQRFSPSEIRKRSKELILIDIVDVRRLEYHLRRRSHQLVASNLMGRYQNLSNSLILFEFRLFSYVFHEFYWIIFNKKEEYDLRNSWYIIPLESKHSIADKILSFWEDHVFDHLTATFKPNKSMSKIANFA
jgi:hypothetical protein